ncbi:MAG: hypothetical protein EOO02_24920, partial [Chitinophagaceae bacterium]
MHWYQVEKDYFNKQGWQVQDEAFEATIAAHGLKRMMLSARERLVIIAPTRINGANVMAPFFLEEFRCKFNLDRVMMTYSSGMSTLPWQPDVSLLKQASTISLPQPADYLKVPKGAGPREEESFTSLENLLQHPAIWYFKYKLRLRHYDSVDIPRVGQLRGNIADSVIRQLFTAENQKTTAWKKVDKFELLTRSTLQEVLLQEGFPFLEVREKQMLAAYTEQLVKSVICLREFVISNKFSIVGSQIELTGKIGDQAFKGWADLILTKEKRNYIFDLKWSGYLKRFREKIEAGRDLQLAVYRQLDSNAIAAGYILINNAKVLMRDEPREHEVEFGID